ncbi:hypothetical protein K5R88_08220 [Pseudomonas sp. MM213]|nr:hypothetical protein [Pseudomonas sp. MM213]UCP13115.1 hypothetical protein K5R88_08220 [Pseudomonas sp. MM213]
MKLLVQLYRAKIPVYLGIKLQQVLGDTASGVSGVQVSTGSTSIELFSINRFASSAEQRSKAS